MEDNIARLGRLRARQEALREGGLFRRFLEFAANVDMPLFKSTAQDYAAALDLGFFATFFTLLLGATARGRSGAAQDNWLN
jgi:hypothetical protein